MRGSWDRTGVEQGLLNNCVASPQGLTDISRDKIPAVVSIKASPYAPFRYSARANVVQRCVIVTSKDEDIDTPDLKGGN